VVAASLDDPVDVSRALVVYGGGGHGKCVIDLVRRITTLDVVGVVDDTLAPGSLVLGVPVVGDDGSLDELRRRGVRLAANAVGGIGSIQTRAAVSRRLAGAGFTEPPLVHPSAEVEPSFSPSAGLQAFAHVYVGSDVTVGPNTILNTATVVSHDCRLGECVNLSPGALLAGGVHVGALTLVGMGATINVGVKVGSGVRIGNSAVVKDDVPDGTVVRAGAVWPAREPGRG
jgi:acetyltransferase EpsM